MGEVVYGIDFRRHLDQDKTLECETDGPVVIIVYHYHEHVTPQYSAPESDPA